jgi:hypothetical protein
MKQRTERSRISLMNRSVMARAKVSLTLSGSFESTVVINSLNQIFEPVIFADGNGGSHLIGLLSFFNIHSFMTQAREQRYRPPTIRVAIGRKATIQGEISPH